MKRRSWKHLGKEEQSLKLQQLQTQIAKRAEEDRPKTPKQWRELAYDHDIPENVVRRHFDPEAPRSSTQTYHQERREARKAAGKTGRFSHT